MIVPHWYVYNQKQHSRVKVKKYKPHLPAILMNNINIADNNVMYKEITTLTHKKGHKNK